MTKQMEKVFGTPQARIESIRSQISEMDWVAQGTITRRMKVCGRPNCRCAQDPAARHGPYYEWTRRQNGRYVHTLVSAEQAKALATAIKNHKRLLSLLSRWSRETARALKATSHRK